MKNINNTLIDMLGMSKYLKTYIALADRIRETRKSKKECKETHGWCENHHIIPTSFDKQYSKVSENIAHATPREHFVLHRLLYNAAKGTKYEHKARAAVTAFLRSNNQNRVMNGTTYEYVRKLAYENARDNNLLSRMGKDNPFYGKQHSEETKQKIREKNSKPLWDRVGGDPKRFWETKKKMSESRATWSLPCSEEKKAAISASNKGKIWINNGVNETQHKGEIPDGWVRGRLFGIHRGEKNHFSKGLTVDQKKKSSETRRRNAAQRHLRYKPYIEEAIANGFTTYYQMAKELNEKGILTTRGGQWQYAMIRSTMITLELFLP